MGKPRFKELRENYNKKNGDIMTDLSIAELARRLNTTDTVIKGFEYGKTKEYKISHIEKYCDYFGVSADYLLGLNDNETVDENVKMISKYTGLTEESIERLHNMNNVYNSQYGRLISALNAILEDDHIIYTLSNLIYPPNNIEAVTQRKSKDGEQSGETIFDENGEGTLILNPQSPNDIHLQKISREVMAKTIFWNDLEEHINKLKELKKDGDSNAKESTLPSKRNRQRNNAKRPKA